jgi:hypothetical protein
VGYGAHADGAAGGGGGGQVPYAHYQPAQPGPWTQYPGSQEAYCVFPGPEHERRPEHWQPGYPGTWHGVHPAPHARAVDGGHASIHGGFGGAPNTSAGSAPAVAPHSAYAQQSGRPPRVPARGGVAQGLQRLAPQPQHDQGNWQARHFDDRLSAVSRAASSDSGGGTSYYDRQTLGTNSSCGAGDDSGGHASETDSLSARPRGTASGDNQLAQAGGLGGGGRPRHIAAVGSGSRGSHGGRRHGGQGVTSSHSAPASPLAARDDNADEHSPASTGTPSVLHAAPLAVWADEQAACRTLQLQLEAAAGVIALHSDGLAVPASKAGAGPEPGQPAAGAPVAAARAVVQAAVDAACKAPLAVMGGRFANYAWQKLVDVADAEQRYQLLRAVLLVLPPGPLPTPPVCGPDVTQPGLPPEGNTAPADGSASPALPPSPDTASATLEDNSAQPSAATESSARTLSPGHPGQQTAPIPGVDNPAGPAKPASAHSGPTPSVDLLLAAARNVYGTRGLQRLLSRGVGGAGRDLLDEAAVAAPPAAWDSLARDAHGYHALCVLLGVLGDAGTSAVVAALQAGMPSLATDKHGCTALEKAMRALPPRFAHQLAATVAAHAHTLAEDESGNYIVSHVLSLGAPQLVSAVAAQLAGHALRLSLHRCASNVVERLLTHAPDEATRGAVIDELTAVGVMAVLVGDGFGNFVVQRAITVASPRQLTQLTQALGATAPYLVGTPGGRRIIARVAQRAPEAAAALAAGRAPEVPLNPVTVGEPASRPAPATPVAHP